MGGLTLFVRRARSAGVGLNAPANSAAYSGNRVVRGHVADKIESDEDSASIGLCHYGRSSIPICWHLLAEKSHGLGAVVDIVVDRS